jgi:hypothetical protein
LRSQSNAKEGESNTFAPLVNEKAEAIERMMRSYAKFNPELINVKHLGALPAKLKR